MGTDITRSTFERENHRSSVRLQQGRVQLDADFNEQADITTHRLVTTTRDVIGRSGAPVEGGGFEIGVSADGSDLSITPGRMYVGGVLAELEPGDGAEITYRTQPDLVVDGAVDPGRYLVYLDVWDREVTAIEEPLVREVALGGPDTATRARVLAQVKLEAIAEEDVEAPHGCDAFGADWLPAGALSNGELRASVEAAAPATTPCVIPPGAGYRRLENQLYRIEIHHGGTAGAGASFKWSRDNGSVAFGVQNRSGATVTVASLGPDAARGLDTGQLVELIDDAYALGLRDEPLMRATVSRDALEVALVPAPSAGLGADATRHPFLRRWDHGSLADGALADGAIPIVEDAPIAIEDGVRVEFRGGRTYRTGDHWLVPARTLTGEVEWPRDPATGDPIFRAPRGIAHRYAALAVARFDGDVWTIEHDCRPLFTPLADEIDFDGIGGDGQEVAPIPGEDPTLPQLLEVRVSRGGVALPDARVRFAIVLGAGALEAGDPARLVSASAADIVVRTDGDGVASCRHTLDRTTYSQRVEAFLLDAADADQQPPIAFNSTLSVATHVAYESECPDLSDAHTVAEALDLLCRRQGHCAVTVSADADWRGVLEALAADASKPNVAICFSPGQYSVFDSPIRFSRKRSIEIHGAGAGSLVEASRAEAALVIEDCDHVHVHDLAFRAMRTGSSGDTEHLRGALDVRRCRAVEIESVWSRCAAGPERRASCISVANDERSPASLVRVAHSKLTPGDQQIGLLVVNGSRVVVEDNVVGAVPNQALARSRFNDLLDHPGYVRRMARHLVDDVRSGRSGDVDVHIRTDYVSFDAHASLRSALRSIDEDVPGLSRASSVTRARELLEAAARDAVVTPGRYRWATQLRSMLRLNRPPVASAGIVVAGQVGRDVRIAHNTIASARRCIVAALSESGSPPAEGDASAVRSLGSVRIADNQLAPQLTLEGKGLDHHGIRVGSVYNLEVLSNTVRVDRKGATSGAGIGIIGIRAWGQLGPRVIILDNFLESVTSGVRVVTISPSSGSPRYWNWERNLTIPV